MDFDLHITIDASPAIETKFSFDDATINPVSPMLSSCDSNEKLAVVEVIDDMQIGCFIMFISDDSSNSNKEIQSNTNHTHQKNIEWQFSALSTDLQSIDTSNFSLKISDIKALNNLSTNEAKEIQSLVEDNEGLSVIGLQSITLVVDCRNSTRYKLIFDSSRTAFIWYKGLKALGHMLAIQKRPSSVFFALVVTDIDRISNTIMNTAMPVVDNQPLQWLKTIEDELPIMSDIINHYRSFAQLSCILDSSEHLLIMCRTLSLKNIVYELDSYLSSGIALSNLSEIREFWWTLNSDLAVVILKTSNVRKQLHSPLIANTNTNANLNTHTTGSTNVKTHTNGSTNVNTHTHASTDSSTSTDSNTNENTNTLIINHKKQSFLQKITANTTVTAETNINNNNSNIQVAFNSNTNAKSSRKNSITDIMKSTMDFFLHKASV